VTFKPSGFSLADVTGRVADGRFALDGEVRRDRGAVSLRSHLKVSNADLPALLAGALRVPAAGRLSLETEMQGQGLSPASLVGSLNGNGTLTAENFEISGLDPGAADAVLNALEADRGLAGNAPRVTQIANTGLDAGKLKIASLTTPIVIADGRAQLTGVQASAQNADISGLVSLALADWQLNARITMTAPPRKNAPGAERPVMTVTTRGPLSAARRNVDVASLINWSTMRAIDQEAKRLEEAERERRRVESTIDALRRQPEAPRQPENNNSVFPPVVVPATPPSSASPSSAQGAAPGFDRRPPRPGGPAVPGP
jgi:uncharacterized protein involved in outer membrane biogenesis